MPLILYIFWDLSSSLTYQLAKKLNPISIKICYKSGLFVDKSVTLGENEIICCPQIKAVFKVLKFVDTLFNQDDWEKNF